ncbi:MAG: DUF4358 domain-containing protein [Oscillospiraceae bacterium]
MKKTKITALVLACLMMLSLLTACGSKVRDDVTTDAIATAVDSAIGNEGNMVVAPESYLESYMMMESSAYSEYQVRINAYGINIDEYGIFKGKDEAQTAALETAVKDYLKLRIDTWMKEYMPEEFPKLENAQVKVVGNYVMYAILDDAGKTAAFAALEKAVKA